MTSTVNKVILAGTVDSVPQTYQLNSSITAICFSLLTKETLRKGHEVVEHKEWHNIKLISKNPEQAKDGLQEGLSVYIEGRIKSQPSTDAQGVKGYKVEIVTQSYLPFTCTNQSMVDDLFEI